MNVHLVDQDQALQFVCPSCKGELREHHSVWVCESEALEFDLTEGIPDFILPSRRQEVELFLSFYSSIRSKEGWGSSSLQYYTELPFRDSSRKFSGVWRLRAKSFQRLLADIQQTFRRTSLRILDLGAGNCWLAHRLSEASHDVVAVDINVDAADGLGTGRQLLEGRFEKFRLVRSEFNFLPFSPSSFDIIVFNASLHYAGDPRSTILNTMGYLRPAGALYVMDSPIYENRESGRRMVREHAADFQKRFAINVPDQFVSSFLTFGQFEEMSSQCRIEFFDPHYGPRWFLNRLLARMMLHRETATFKLIKVRPR